MKCLKFQSMRCFGKIIKTSFILSLAFIISLLNVIPVFAVTQEGDGGAVYEGATVNTFAAGMPLAEIYFVWDVFNGGPSKMEILDNTSGALRVSGDAMMLLGSALDYNKADNNLTGKYRLIYENGAILPDGTTKDVIVTLEFGRVLTVESGNAPIPATTVIFRTRQYGGLPGLNFVVSAGSGPGAGAIFGLGVEQKMTITVDSAGDFVVPFTVSHKTKTMRVPMRRFV